MTSHRLLGNEKFYTSPTLHVIKHLNPCNVTDDKLYFILISISLKWRNCQKGEVIY